MFCIALQIFLSGVEEYRDLEILVRVTIRWIACEFLLVFHYNYDSILYCFRDKARYWSKIAIFSYHLHITCFYTAFCLYVCIFFLCVTILVNKDVYIYNNPGQNGCDCEHLPAVSILHSRARSWPTRCMVQINGEKSYVYVQYTRVTDRQTEK